MIGKCKISDCVAPISCHEGHENISSCPNWENGKTKKSNKEKIKVENNNASNLSWTGEPLQIQEMAMISSRNAPILFGIVGKANAGKTTFLAMLYTLLLNGKKLSGFEFTGTNTILGWDELHFRLRILKESVAFPDPTPFGYIRLLHFALRDKNSLLKDVLFSDVSGEVFSLWSQNREDVNAVTARWVYDNSNAFIFFLDCEDLISRKNLAKTEVIDIAEQLRYNLKSRPVLAVWSKSDKKGEVHPRIKESLQEELKNIFPNYSEIDISNFSTHDPDHLVHVNNLKVVDWLLERILVPSNLDLTIRNNYEDFFLNYKGK
jgi:hypothetical protein